MIDEHLLALRRQRAARIGHDPSAEVRVSYYADAVADAPLPPGPIWIEGLPANVDADFAPNALRTPHLPEAPLPFADGHFAAVLWIDGLRNTRDVPAALHERRRVLMPGGRLLADAPGGNTLLQLRTVLRAAEIAETGGLSPRFQPVFDVRDAGMLLQRCGFAQVAVTAHTQTVHYRQLRTLFADLRAAAATDVPASGVHPLPRRVYAAAERLYRERFATADGLLIADFEVLLCSAHING